MNIGKILDKQTEYNMNDGLSCEIHNYVLKKLGLDLDKISTDESNDLMEIVDDVLAQMYSELEDRLDGWRKNEERESKS